MIVSNKLCEVWTNIKQAAASGGDLSGVGARPAVGQVAALTASCGAPGARPRHLCWWNTAWINVVSKQFTRISDCHWARLAAIEIQMLHLNSSVHYQNQMQAVDATVIFSEGVFYYHINYDAVVCNTEKNKQPLNKNYLLHIVHCFTFAYALSKLTRFKHFHVIYRNMRVNLS